MISRLKLRSRAQKLPSSNNYAMCGPETAVSVSGLFYANSEPQPNAKYSCAASVAIAR